MKSEGRSTTPVAANSNRIETVSGSKALNQAAQLLFETGDLVTTGVDLADLKGKPSRLGPHARQGAIGLAGLSEPETLRHYVRLSQQNYAIDLGVYPLGSCTCLLYTSPSPRDATLSRMPSSA